VFPTFMNKLGRKFARRAAAMGVEAHEPRDGNGAGGLLPDSSLIIM
jgi:hypothetical protein